jgi:hypothetical protein
MKGGAGKVAAKKAKELSVPSKASASPSVTKPVPSKSLGVADNRPSSGSGVKAGVKGRNKDDDDDDDSDDSDDSDSSSDEEPSTFPVGKVSAITKSGVISKGLGSRGGGGGGGESESDSSSGDSDSSDDEEGAPLSSSTNQSASRDHDDDGDSDGEEPTNLAVTTGDSRFSDDISNSSSEDDESGSDSEADGDEAVHDEDGKAGEVSLDLEDPDVADYIKKRKVSEGAAQAKQKAVDKIVKKKSQGKAPTLAMQDPRKAVRSLYREIRKAKAFEISKGVRKLKKLSSEGKPNEKLVTRAKKEVEDLKSTNVFDIIKSLLPGLLGSKRPNTLATEHNTALLLKKKGVVELMYSLSQRSWPKDGFWKRSSSLSAGGGSSGGGVAGTSSSTEGGNSNSKGRQGKKDIGHKQQIRAASYKAKADNERGVSSMFMSSLAGGSGVEGGSGDSSKRIAAARANRDMLSFGKPKKADNVGSASESGVSSGKKRPLESPSEETAAKRQKSEYHVDKSKPFSSYQPPAKVAEQPAVPVKESAGGVVDKIHPSWAASRIAKSKQSGTLQPAGKKITFDDDD